jgi:hypothetical protein
MGVQCTEEEFCRIANRVMKDDGKSVDANKLQALCELENVGKLGASPPPERDPKDVMLTYQVSSAGNGTTRVDRGKRITGRTWQAHADHPSCQFVLDYFPLLIQLCFCHHHSFFISCFFSCICFFNLSL